MRLAGHRNVLRMLPHTNNLYWYGSRWYDDALGRFIQADTDVPESQGPQALDRYAYVNNSPINYTDPTGHGINDGCGTRDCDDGNDNSISNLWDPTDKGQVGDPHAAELAYQHFLNDPAYFALLYANPEKWAASDEVANLDVFMQYSSLHASAQSVILSGFDPDVAANLEMAHVFYGLGDTEKTSEYLTAAILVGTPSRTLISIPDGWTGRVADNSLGIVYQRPGAIGNADSIRIMDAGANSSYPLGYVRYYNSFGQPINPLTGRPGTAAETHISMNYNGPLNRWPR
jgi:RHS repeat-associated protein